MSVSSVHSPQRAVAFALAATASTSVGIALGHMWATAQRGAICGLGQADHCWACYAAPLLALAALAAWRPHRQEPASTPAPPARS